jgi:hypothetical protein
MTMFQSMLRRMIPDLEFDHAVMLHEQERLVLSEVSKRPTIGWHNRVEPIVADMEVYFNESPRLRRVHLTSTHAGAETLCGEKSRRWRCVSFGGYLHEADDRPHGYYPTVYTVIHVPSLSVVFAVASGGRKGWKKSRRRAEEVWQALTQSGRPTRSKKTQRSQSGNEAVIKHNAERIRALKVQRKEAEQPSKTSASVPLVAAENPPKPDVRRSRGDNEMIFSVTCRNATEALALCHCLGQGYGMATQIRDGHNVVAWRGRDFFGEK